MFTTESNPFTIYLNVLFLISLSPVFSWSDCLTVHVGPADVFFSDLIVFPDLWNILREETVFAKSIKTEQKMLINQNDFGPIS